MPEPVALLTGLAAMIFAIWAMEYVTREHMTEADVATMVFISALLVLVTLGLVFIL